ncbi:hypothetical protein GGS23DRAFT_563719 [Durotheca rogersii]|uniref:uncharacterized protein n=1 Tax=Durotheca rogersii TaxID=419775 RepID=UPI00221EC6E6|nr:uncharacterized protein GGS23DRAFT_563719 [Durotheca rogersii]KAI5864293.1 hypothetical protein GGS23DRAFT_563719 [Durotheca rogersii]
MIILRSAYTTESRVCHHLSMLVAISSATSVCCAILRGKGRRCSTTNLSMIDLRRNAQSFAGVVLGDWLLSFSSASARCIMPHSSTRKVSLDTSPRLTAALMVVRLCVRRPHPEAFGLLCMLSTVVAGKLRGLGRGEVGILLRSYNERRVELGLDCLSPTYKVRWGLGVRWMRKVGNRLKQQANYMEVFKCFFCSCRCCRTQTPACVLRVSRVTASKARSHPRRRGGYIFRFIQELYCRIIEGTNECELLNLSPPQVCVIVCLLSVAYSSLTQNFALVSSQPSQPLYLLWTRKLAQEGFSTQ